jgi:hypothetical protein
MKFNGRRKPIRGIDEVVDLLDARLSKVDSCSTNDLPLEQVAETFKHVRIRHSVDVADSKPVAEPQAKLLLRCNEERREAVEEVLASGVSLRRESNKVGSQHDLPALRSFVEAKRTPPSAVTS